MCASTLADTAPGSGLQSQNRSHGTACGICVSGPEGLQRRNRRVLEMNNVKLGIGHIGDRSFLKFKVRVIDIF
jgi:hypothetical protein